MIQSALKLLALFPRIAKNKAWTITWEYSDTLAWIIVTQGKRQLCITYFDSHYKITPIEAYQHVGYLQSLTRTKSIITAMQTVNMYFSFGYKKLFLHELSRRSSSKSKSISLQDMGKWLSRLKRNTKRRKTKPQSLEFPPSLKETIKLASDELKNLKKQLAIKKKQDSIG